jgi:rhodanese-related sulfurtransferase
MRKFVTKTVLILMLFFAIGILCVPLDARSDVPTMTKEELKAHIGVKDFFVIDVRTASDWKKSEYKIKGALREDPDTVRDWASKYQKDKAIVLYCA